MTDIKTNLRDGAYVALGAAALGVQHLSRKRDGLKAHFDTVSSRIEPVVKDVTPRIKDAGDRMYTTLSPVAEKISAQLFPAAKATAGKVSSNISPVANSVVTQMKSRAEQAVTSGRKIADEAKRRVS